MSYCAIIGDVVDSRNIENRNELTIELENSIDKINSKYKDSLIAKFMINSGDEIQGLLETPKYSYRIIKEIRKIMGKTDLVFGIGVGKVSTEIPKKFENVISVKLDGEAYHRAKDMLIKAKKKKPTICYNFADPAYSLVNSLIYFIELNQSFRTKRQEEIIELYKKFNSQTKVAEELGISQATVNEHLKKSFYYEIKEAEQEIESYLASIHIDYL